MSVKLLLRSTYGDDITKITTSYQRCAEKLSKFRNHIVFNARCKRDRIIPESLRIKSPINTDQGRKIAERAGHQYVNERLRLANYKVRQLEDEMKWREIGLRRRLSNLDFERVCDMSKRNADIVFEAAKDRQVKKYKKLQAHEDRSSDFPTQCRNFIINLSKHELNDDERKVLEKGLNFATTPKSIPRADIITGVETAIRQCKSINVETAERTRAAVANVIRHAKPPAQNIRKKEAHAISTLRKNNAIVILQADKGNSTVVLDTDTYYKKAAAILDHSPFKEVKQNPTTKNEKKVNDKLKQLREKNKITEPIYSRLRAPPNATRTPLFYGNVKVHKPEMPLRPIVSTIGSATYGIARFINEVLSQYVRNSETYIENTKYFLEEIKDIEIGEDEVMVSFDVKSLFTNVPTEDAVKTIEDFVTDDAKLEERIDMSPSTFMELVKLCLSTTEFQFRNKYYRLDDGLPMGSPASPCIANLFMIKFEKTALESFPVPPKLWRRYVDDVFSIVRRDQVNNLLQHLNAQHPNITFTTEMEKDHKLPFMDVSVHRVQNRLRTSVYRKPTHTGRYLNFESNHTNTAKRSVIHSLIDRMEYVTLEGEDAKDKEMEQIERDLQMNGFPTLFIQNTTKRRFKNRATYLQPSLDSKVIEAVAAIPYVRGVSESISRILKKVNIRTVMRPDKLKWKLMKRAKDSVLAEDTTGVVYAIGCADCPQIYIGETARTAKQRTREHKCHTNMGHTEMSAIAEHAHNESHNIYWKARVIARDQHTTKRKIKESMAINRAKKASGASRLMNKDSGLELSNIWLDLL